MLQLYYDGGVFPVPEAVLEDRKKDPDSSEMFKILDRKKFASILKLRIPSDDDIQRAHVFTNSIVGPSWQDTVASSTEVLFIPLNPLKTRLENGDTAGSCQSGGNYEWSIQPQQSQRRSHARHGQSL